MSWPTEPLGAICEIVSGITKDSKKQGDNYREVPYLRVANVQRLQLDLSEVKLIPAKESTIASYRLESGDILLNEGGDRDKLGRGWIWQGQISECIHQNHVFRARIRDGKAIPKWIAYYANTNEARAYFLATGKQTTNLASISKKNLSALPVPLPPVQVQETLVAEIDKQLSRLDETVTTLQGIQAKLKQARASILKAAVEGRLVETEADIASQSGQSYVPANQQLAQINLELGRKREAIGPEDSGRRSLPEGWARCKLGCIGRWTSGGTPSRRNPSYFGGEIPWVKTGELNDSAIRRSEESITDEGIRNSAAKLFPRGTLLVAMYGATIGMTGILSIDASTNQACAALLPTSGNIESMRYFQLFLQSQRRELREAGQGGAQPNISQGILKDWILLLPPIAEQRRIVAEVDRRFSVLDQVEATVTASLARCGKLRQAILKRAFEGRLVPAT